MRIEFPDYNNCCVNLMNSVAKHFGLKAEHNTLPIVDKELQKEVFISQIKLAHQLKLPICIHNIYYLSVLLNPLIQALSIQP